jgi:hypothetical protein
MTKCRKLLIAALAGATMMTGAVPALARDDVGATTQNGAGQALFTKIGTGQYVLQACDLTRDGYGVRAYASYTKGAMDNWVRDVDGANGNCKSKSVYATAGKTVYIKVCLRDHDGSMGKGKADFSCASMATKAK